MFITNEHEEVLIMGDQIRKKLTEESIKKLKLKSKPYYAYDTKTLGLTVRVNPGGKKTFYFLYTPQGNSSTQQILLGSVDKMTITEARSKAKTKWAIVNTDDDPLVVRERQKTEPKVYELIEDYFKNVLSKKSEKTIKSVESCLNAWILNRSTNKDINKLIDYSIKDKYISKIKQSDIEHIFTVVTKRGDYAANRMVVYLKTVFNYAIKKKYIQVNPCVGIEKHEETDTLEYLSDVDYERVIDMAFCEDKRSDDPRLNINHYNKHGLSIVSSVAIAFVLLTGRRGYSEGTKIKWEWINTRTQKLTLPKTKTTKRAICQIPDDAFDLLKAIRSARFLKEWSYSDERNEFVFPSSRYVGPITNVNKTWTKILELLNIKYIPFKQCRHSFATYMLKKNGGNIPQVQKALLHTNAKTTGKYAKVMDQDLKDTYSNMSRRNRRKNASEVINFPKLK